MEYYIHYTPLPLFFNFNKRLYKYFVEIIYRPDKVSFKKRTLGFFLKENYFSREVNLQNLFKIIE